MRHCLCILVPRKQFFGGVSCVQDNGKQWGLEGIWISMPVSDALAFITAVISLMIYIKKVSKQHPVVAE